MNFFLPFNSERNELRKASHLRLNFSTHFFYLDYGLTNLDCSNINMLNTNEVYPTGAASPEDIVGEVDEAITRDNQTDFNT